MTSNHLILCPPLLFPPSIFPSIKVFSNESVLRIRWPKVLVSASSSVLPMNTQDWSPLGWTGWISLQSKRPSRVFSNINDSNFRRRVLWVPMGFRTYYTKIWPFSILNILNWRNLRKGMYRKGFLPFPRSRSLNRHVRGDFLYSEEGTQRGMWMNKPWQFPPVYYT